MYATGGPSVSTEYTYRGLDAVFLENDELRIMVLPEKGSDILEFRDKRRDVNVLWQADHNWVPPGERYVPSERPTTWQTDHYPGGWQVNLPIAGGGMEFHGSAYGLHGESALVPWEMEIVRDDDDAASIRLRTELLRYPFALERTLTLPDGESRLEIDEAITNRGNVPLEYVWQQHVALGPPLLGPAARLDIPAETGVTETASEPFENGRLAGEQRFEWPMAPARDGGDVDLGEIPPRGENIHDQAYALDLREGWYALTNPDLDLGFGLTFPRDPFECVWYWQPFGGFSQAPFYNRNYNVGLEPTTAYPSGNIPDAQRSNGTMKTLDPGETVTAEFTARTYTGYESIDSVEPAGPIGGTEIE